MRGIGADCVAVRDLRGRRWGWSTGHEPFGCSAVRTPSRKPRASLVRCLPASGVAFLKGMTSTSARIAGAHSAAITLYGLGEELRVERRHRAWTPRAGPPSHWCHRPAPASVKLPVPGRHNVYNALAAAAVALRSNRPRGAIAAKLATADMWRSMQSSIRQRPDAHQRRVQCKSASIGAAVVHLQRWRRVTANRGFERPTAAGWRQRTSSPSACATAS